MIDRIARSSFAITVGVVAPDDWLIQVRTTRFKNALLDRWFPSLIAVVGYDSFATPLRVHASIQVFNAHSSGTRFVLLDLPEGTTYREKPPALRANELQHREIDELRQRNWKATPGPRFGSLDHFADVREGLKAGDVNLFERFFWEVVDDRGRWDLLQDAPDQVAPFRGRQRVVLWERESGRMAQLAESVKGLNHVAQNWRRGKPFWGKHGICFGLMGSLPATLYTGEKYSANCAVIVPKQPELLRPLWAFAESGEWARGVRDWNHGNAVTPHALLRVPFDLKHWQSQVENGQSFPAPSSDDLTQWLFDGCVTISDQPLQVVMARLLGYQWPEQRPDRLDKFADTDGIAALQSLPGELDLATRLRELLAAAYGDQWSSGLERTFVTEAGGKNGRLEDLLRDTFFAQHVKVFENRPFLWHIWDSRRDGFSAIVNYHKFDHRKLEKLTFTSLGAWIVRQKHEAAASRAGADARLAAAEDLQERLRLILVGAPPYDVYVRWKELHEQPIGWNPDLDDGVRLNIRPFVTAGVLRSNVNVHWKMDRGTNPNGSERINDLHPTLEERRAARRLAGMDS